MTVDKNSIPKENDLIQQGNEAEALLGSEAFNSTVNNLVEETFQQFVNSKPADTEAREQIYNNYRALVSIVHTLQQRVAVREEINLRNSDNNGE